MQMIVKRCEEVSLRRWYLCHYSLYL